MENIKMEDFIIRFSGEVKGQDIYCLFLDGVLLFTTTYVNNLSHVAFDICNKNEKALLDRVVYLRKVKLEYRDFPDVVAKFELAANNLEKFIPKLLQQ